MLNKHEEIQKTVQEAFSRKLQQLPTYTKAVVTTLYYIYQFDQLPEKYFANLDLLPTNLANLHLAVRDLFPSTDRKCLRELDNYKRKLSQYYEVKTISPDYFDLPQPKVRLSWHTKILVINIEATSH
ncbi:13941_t:CDS:2 [Ambispora leptoticha]|uniref:13941_t:CDS:1 n=1 Tax=Ambispora leptoticha TaxID=144679 RepID=A0A9N9ENF8_9GLOM|nr:13941_t:CDS:2 [Ambispora leptoticha]